VRSTRVLTVLLVVLVLVPTGILGWLGVRGTDRFEAELRERLQRELDEQAVTARRAIEDWAAGEEADSERRVVAAADLLARRLPLLPAGQALAEAERLWTRLNWRTERLGFPATMWLPEPIELRVVDASGRTVLPVLFEPDGYGRERAESVRLFQDLGREAEVSLFGRGDRAGAMEIWRSAAARFTEPMWKARAEIEALSLECTVDPTSDVGPRVLELESRFSTDVLDRVGRPWVVLLMRAAPASGVALAHLQALFRRGGLAEIPLTEQERDRVRQAVGAPSHWGSPPPPPSPRKVKRAQLPGGLLLEASWPDDHRGVESRLLLPLRKALPDSTRLDLVQPRLGDPASDGQRALTQAVELPPKVGGQRAWLVLAHRNETDLLADVASSRRWTIVGVLSLVGVIGLGLVLGRSALAREREARRLKDDFLANVSHELRTPLTSVCLHADLLAESGLTEPQRRAHAEVVRAEGARLSALVDDLLDFAALERGSRRLEPEPVDLAAAAERAVAPFRVLADREGVTLTLELAPGETLALADPHALGRILSNLVGNAWKHGRPSRDGGPGRLVIRAWVADGRPSVDVVDDGPGIPPNERAHLFERFRRGAAAGKTRGVGLGLALSRDLARALGGDLSVVEDPARTVFRLTLPPVPPPPPESTTEIPA